MTGELEGDTPKVSTSGLCDFSQAAKFENATYIGFKVCNDLIVLHIKYKFGRNSPQRLVGRQIASALVPD